MKDFISRQVTFESDDDLLDGAVKLEVTRYRTSAGGNGIIIKVDEKQLRLEGDGCGVAASELSRLLDQAYEHNCPLPKVEP